jgi:hypothetical protein
MRLIDDSSECIFLDNRSGRDLRGDSGKIGRVTANAMTLAKR